MRHPALVACTVALTVLAACGGQQTAPAPWTPQPPGPLVLSDNEPIVLGVSAALSGEQAQLGQDLADAVDLAIEDFGREIAGHPVQSSREDDGCNDPETAVEAARTLIEARAAVVIGPMCATGALAANDEYDRAGIVHITPSATRPDLSSGGSPLFFRVSWRDDAEAALQARFMLAEHADSAVVVDDGEPYGRELAAAFTAAFTEAGAEVFSHERLRRGETDYAALARQIITAGADAVVYQGLNPEGALLVRDLRDAGFDGLFIGPDSLFSVDDFIETADGAAEDAVLTAGPVPDDAFNERFLARFGRMPATAFVLQAYDAARVALTAIETAAYANGDLIIDGGAVADAMRSSSFAGLTGSIHFGATGDRIGVTPRDLGLTVIRVAGGAFEVVE